MYSNLSCLCQRGYHRRQARMRSVFPFIKWQQSWKWQLLSTEVISLLSLNNYSSCWALLRRIMPHFQAWLRLLWKEGHWWGARGREAGEESLIQLFLHSPSPCCWDGRHGNYGYFPASSPSFHPALSLPHGEVREGHQAHNPSWHLTGYPHPCWGKTPGQSGFSIQRRRNWVIYESNYFSLG